MARTFDLLLKVTGLISIHDTDYYFWDITATRSTQPCFPHGSLNNNNNNDQICKAPECQKTSVALNRVPAVAEVKTGTSRLPGDR